MKPDVKSKIVMLIYLICLFEAQCSKFQDKGVSLKLLDQEIAKSVIKRSEDWSKRISPSTSFEAYGHAVAESENIEVTSKPPRIIRRLRIQNGEKQTIETFKEINPNTRPNGRIKKIVRVKKFRRKTTPEPVMTTPEITTTTRKPRISSSTSLPKMTYAHITVINKETKNPKKKKNRKNHKYLMVSTPSYDIEAKTNGLMEVSENFRNQINKQENLHKYPFPHLYSPRERYNYMVEDRLRTEYQDKNLEERESEYINLPILNDNFKNTNAMMTNHNEKIMDGSFYPLISELNYKYNSPRRILFPYRHFQDSETDFHESNKENLKESSSQLKEVVSNLQTNSSESPPKFGDKLRTTQPKIMKDYSSNSTLKLEEPPVTPPFDKIINKTENSDTKNATESISQITTTPAYIYIRSTTPQEYRFPVRFPSLLFGEQNAFSDPFFDTPQYIPPRRPGIMAWNHPLSPFYASDGSQNDGSYSNSEIQPYHSSDVVPGFHHSPELASLRRSILDTYGEETTTSEPVTPFSLPKFEIPPIDFSDKGCQTVYKEIKTVPGDRSHDSMNNQKSFIMTRECIFPNGVPTTEQVEDGLSTEDPITKKRTLIKEKP